MHANNLRWIASTYKVDFSSAANTNNLSNAIKRGSETGHLSLPKGISGCVKLTPKVSLFVTNDF